MKKIRFLALVLVALVLLPLASCTTEEKKPRSKSYFEYFDTVSAIYSYADETDEQFEENCREIEAIFEKYNKELDIYYEYSGMNNLCTVNKKAGKEAVTVTPELMDFLVLAKEMYSKTDGKTNIAMGAVLSIWHDFRSDAIDDPENSQVPTLDVLRVASEHTSIESLLLDRESLTVRFADPELKLDVGALGKGYVATLAAELLEEKGASSYVLNVGGNIRAVGEKVSGDGWITGITNPDRSSSDFAERVVLRDTSCVTSGNYERFYEYNGKRYHHIIDPDTLMPAENFASVTVICEDSFLADALSTALFCMSYEEALEFLDDYPHVEVLWIYENGEKKMTDGFSSLIHK